MGQGCLKVQAMVILDSVIFICAITYWYKTLQKLPLHPSSRGGSHPLPPTFSALGQGACQKTTRGEELTPLKHGIF